MPKSVSSKTSSKPSPKKEKKSATTASKSAKTTPKATKATKAKTAKPAKKVVVQTGGGLEEEDSRNRYFKVILAGGDPQGRFSGTKPKQAATKALTSILRTKKSNEESTVGEFEFSIVECTRGSKHKTYNYTGERVKLDNPMTVQIGGGKDGGDKKTITYKYNNRVMKNKNVVVAVAVGDDANGEVKASTKKSGGAKKAVVKADKKSADKKSADKKPVDKKPVAKKLAAKKPVKKSAPKTSSA